MFLKEENLRHIGFATLGKNAQISDKAVFYSPENIYIGDNVRIDDFTILSAGGRIVIEDYVHIANHCSVVGKGTVTFRPFSGLSARVSVFSSTDPYNGQWLTNPCVPEEYKSTRHADVMFGRHVVIGAGSVILPGVYLPSGCAVGALSLVRAENYAFEPLSILAGTPAKVIGYRGDRIFLLEQELLSKR